MVDRRIAVTGHRGLSTGTTRLVDIALRNAVAEVDVPIIGISCLADGADQLFARAVLDHGGALEVIVPAEKYRAGLPAECGPEYDALIARAIDIHTLDHVESTAQAHMEASAYMIDNADAVFAVWDGQPARGYGGTADIVSYARQHDVPVTVIWPDDASRG